MNKTEFITKMLEIGAGVELSASKQETELWIKDANKLYDEYFTAQANGDDERIKPALPIQNIRGSFSEDEIKAYEYIRKVKGIPQTDSIQDLAYSLSIEEVIDLMEGFAVVKNNADLAIVRERFSDFAKFQQDVPPEIMKVVIEKFWDML